MTSDYQLKALAKLAYVEALNRVQKRKILKDARGRKHEAASTRPEFVAQATKTCRC